MRIDHVTVRYGELRSTGYPSFSNTRIEVELGAAVEPNDVPSDVRNVLLQRARDSVREHFRAMEQDPMEARA